MILIPTRLKGRSLQYFTVSSGLLNILSCGCHLGWPAPYLPELLNANSPIPITNSQGSWIAVILLIGGVCGAPLSSVFLDRIGRKQLLILSTVPFFVSWLIIAFASTLAELYIARFIAGLSYGMTFSTLPLFIAEISDTSIRGLFLSSISFTQLCGVLIINVIGSYLSIKTVAFIGLILPTYTFLSFLCVPDTPYYYIVKNNIEMAIISMRMYTGMDEVDGQIDNIKVTLADSKNTSSKLINFFMNKNSRRAVCIVLVIYIVQQWTGIFAFVFYLPVIFEYAEMFVPPLASSCIYYGLQIVFCFISMIIIDRVGRKPLLLISVFVVSISLFIVGIFFAITNLLQIDLTDYAWVPLLGLFLFIIGYSLGLYSIPILFIGELFPINVKAVVGSFFEVSFCIISTLASKYFQYTKDEFGLHVPFLTYAFCCICGLPFMFFYVFETKVKSLEQIQTDLEEKVQKNKLTKNQLV